MTGFHTVICTDWSARAQPSPARPSADAIWIAVARNAAEAATAPSSRQGMTEGTRSRGGAERRIGAGLRGGAGAVIGTGSGDGSGDGSGAGAGAGVDGEAASAAVAVRTHYLRTRHAARGMLMDLLAGELAAGRRVLAGFDFPFGYPQGYAAALTGTATAFAVWDWLRDRVCDGPQNANNRFEMAAAINARLPGLGPFWGRPGGLDLPALPDRGSLRHGHGMTERRRVEIHVRRAQPVWKLYTTGSVGSQALLGLPVLAALRDRFGGALAVWPLDPPARVATARIVLAEIYPGLIDTAVRAELAAAGGIKDEVQVRLLAQVLLGADLPGLLTQVPDWPGRAEEGWILGPRAVGGAP